MLIVKRRLMVSLFLLAVNVNFKSRLKLTSSACCFDDAGYPSSYLIEILLDINKTYDLGK